MKNEERKINTPSKEESFTELDQLLQNPFALPTETRSVDGVSQQTPTFDTLDENQQKQANELSAKIMADDLNAILNYGAAAQKEISDFSHSILNHVQMQEVGEIGHSISDLMFQLKAADPKDLSPEKQGFLSRVFNKTKRSIYETTAKYQKIGSQIDKIALKLDHEKNLLMKDNEILNDLYEKNLNFYQALNIYIAAGELRIKELQEAIIPQALKEAEQEIDQMGAQKVNDLNQFTNRLEKRVHDLKITKQLTIQQAPQIRMIQNTNQQLSEKIQTSIHTAIPLWKNQMVIALTLLRQHDAVSAQRQVSDTTNELLMKNSEMLKQSAVDTAVENERAIIDVETLATTQQNLMDTLRETLAIQKEGRQKRMEVEKELLQMESQMRTQLLEITQEAQRHE
ncbi:toxic anion resistance protein [Allofustis seminis]|uniref:toxic anion resistance protein n=1 Tax=Allofustis seminis TaxID=166939 RepID=UPI00035E45DE|nr:toxic anion resistance protein [Allofustis seminis]